MNDEFFTADDCDEFVQSLYGEIANLIANPKYPAGLKILVEGSAAGDTQDRLLLAMTFLMERHAKLLVAHLKSKEAALFHLNQMTTLSTLRRIEEGGEG